MLEDYYVKPSTIDRVRSSWMAPQIESYLEWLQAHGYSRLVVHRRLPLLFHFQQISGEVLQVQQGSLYPVLHRLEQQGWVRAKWAETETGREAKFYSLTAAGRKQLDQETANWRRLSAAIDLVIEHT